MTEQHQHPTGHPMVTAIGAAHAAVDEVLDLPEWSMDSAATTASLQLLVALENKVAALKLRHLAVTQFPGSGTGDELLDFAGISAPHIADAARALLA